MPCWREETVLSPSGDVEGDKTRTFQEERESNIGLCGVGQTVWGCCCNQKLAWLLNNRHLFTWLQTSTRSQGELAGLGKREMAWSTGNEAIYARYIATMRHGQIYDNAFFPLSVFWLWCPVGWCKKGEWWVRNRSNHEPLPNLFGEQAVNIVWVLEGWLVFFTCTRDWWLSDDPWVETWWKTFY